jgi:hypothetical protein
MFVAATVALVAVMTGCTSGGDSSPPNSFTTVPSVQSTVTSTTLTTTSTTRPPTTTTASTTTVPEPPQLELLSDTPPWGLTSIEMPDTEEDVIAVIAALPDEIDGRRRPGVGDADLIDRPPPLGVSYGGAGHILVVNANPAEDLQLAFGYPNQTPAEIVIEMASFNRSLGTIEMSALDLDGDLVWIAANAVWEQLNVPPEQQETFYTMTWAQPGGSWAFFIEADSAAGRTELVHAFITAAGG